MEYMLTPARVNSKNESTSPVSLWAFLPSGATACSPLSLPHLLISGFAHLADFALMLFIWGNFSAP